MSRFMPRWSALVALVVLPTLTLAAPVAIFNTGVDDGGALLAGGSVDPHYVLLISPDAGFPGPNAIVTSAIPGP